MEFQPYRRKKIVEMRPYVEGEDVSKVYIDGGAEKNGSPKVGDMIARNPDNHDDQWLVTAEYFEAYFEPV